MADGSYNQFCPVAMAAEILCGRWTLLLLRELVAGSTRFNDLRRGVPRMSPALLSKRLKDLEAAGIVERRPVAGEVGVHDYVLTPAGRELKPVIMTLGHWGQRWIETSASLDNLDPNLLMWDIRRNIDTTPMPERRSTIQMIFRDLPAAKRNWWLVVQPPHPVDLCSLDPGHDVDLYVTTDLRTLTSVWMGYKSVERAREDDAMIITGNRQLEGNLRAWLKLSPFAPVKKLVA